MHHDPLVLDDGVTVLYIEIPAKLRDGDAAELRGQRRLGIGSLATNTWATTDFLLDGLIGFAHGILVYRDGATIKAVRFDVKRRHAVGEPVVIDGLPPGIDNEVMASNGTLVFHAVSARYRLNWSTRPGPAR